MSILRHQVLVAELGLHGEGSLAYHMDILARLRSSWLGWPKIAVKVQLWTDLDAPWGELIQKTHGRPPLGALSEGNLAALAEVCHQAEIYLGATVHDVGAAEMVARVPRVSYVKISGTSCLDVELCKAAEETGLPFVVSVPQRLWEEMPPKLHPGVIQLQAHDAYPANKPFVPIEGQPWGYSCHSVPSRAMAHCIEAAEQGARMIEVHVTAREASKRPMPGDYPVSMPVDDFIALAQRIGTIWNAS